MPVVDGNFRVNQNANRLKQISPCVCPFHDGFKCLIEDLIPEKYRKGEVFSKKCTSKHMIFTDWNSFAQHCRGSNDWHHDMLLKYISVIHDKPSILEKHKANPNKKKRRKKTKR